MRRAIVWVCVLLLVLMSLWVIALISLKVVKPKPVEGIKVDTVYYDYKPYYPQPKLIDESGYYDTVVFTEEDSILSSY